VGAQIETPPPNPLGLGSPMFCIATPRHQDILMKTGQGSLGDLRGTYNYLPNTALAFICILAAISNINTWNKTYVSSFLFSLEVLTTISARSLQSQDTENLIKLVMHYHSSYPNFLFLLFRSQKYRCTPHSKFRKKFHSSHTHSEHNATLCEYT